VAAVIKTPFLYTYINTTYTEKDMYWRDSTKSQY